MTVSLDQISIFVTAARSRSFSDAARRLGRSQSAVSSSISDLEIDLGVSLFDRSQRYPVLTSAGDVLLAEAEAILSHRDSLIERAHALQGGQEQELHIGMEAAVPTDIFAGPLLTLRQQFPTVKLSMHQPANHDLVAMLLAGDISFGLGCARANYPPDIAFCRLGNVVWANVVSKDHALASEETVTFAQLGDHLQLMMKTQTQGLLTSEYLRSPMQWSVEGESAMRDCLRAGLGWAAVPHRLVADLLRSGECIELKLASYPFTQWNIGLDLLWARATRQGVVASWFRKQLSENSTFGR
jgi:DNA-binding transcriptional LysR family regulator